MKVSPECFIQLCQGLTYCTKEKYCRNYAGYWYIKVQVKKDRKIVVIKVQVKRTGEI